MKITVTLIQTASKSNKEKKKKSSSHRSVTSNYPKQIVHHCTPNGYLTDIIIYYDSNV